MGLFSTMKQHSIRFESRTRWTKRQMLDHNRIPERGGQHTPFGYTIYTISQSLALTLSSSYSSPTLLILSNCVPPSSAVSHSGDFRPDIPTRGGAHTKMTTSETLSWTAICNVKFPEFSYQNVNLINNGALSNDPRDKYCWTEEEDSHPELVIVVAGGTQGLMFMFPRLSG